MGDIHGANIALEQCLERSGFNKEKDRLIQLGDVTDSYGDVYNCVETLLSIKNLIALKGNHDEWFREFLETGYHPEHWLQGAMGTAISYLRLTGRESKVIHKISGWKTALQPSDVPASHIAFFKSQHLYFIDETNNCFVHAGFNRLLPFEEQQRFVYYWDRGLWNAALESNGILASETSFNEIFIGHTPTTNWQTDKPMKAANVINMDTGAGHSGRLTIMHLPSHKYWQSDVVTGLYQENFRHW